jgi:hypothetical protein
MKSSLVGGDFRAVALSSEAGSVHGQRYFEYHKLPLLHLQHPVRSHLYSHSSHSTSTSSSSSSSRAHRPSILHQALLIQDPRAPHTGPKRRL